MLLVDRLDWKSDLGEMADLYIVEDISLFILVGGPLLRVLKKKFLVPLYMAPKS